jgi:Domain of unknown function (DUF4350)
VRERLITFACALAALMLFVSLFVHGGGAGGPHATAPTTSEREGNGLLAAREWLEAEGIRSISLRERFDSLSRRRDVPRAGNLLIVMTPTVTSFRVSEIDALRRWVGAGNTLLVLAALSDRPDWSAEGFVHLDVNLLTGLDTTLAQAETAAKDAAVTSKTPPRKPLVTAPSWAPLAQPLRSTLVPNRPHPYLAGVRSAVALSDYPPQAWDVKVPRDGFMLALAHQAEARQAVLWVRREGSGTVILSGFGSLFTNRAIGLADNARLLANIIAGSVAPGGAVLFDDDHQGLANAYDPAKFYRDARLYETLAVIVAVWLVWVLGSTRLRIPSARQLAPREAELVRASGAFLARVLRPSAAARRMFEHFFVRVRALTGADATTGPPWEWLENHPRLKRADVQQLRDWYSRAYAEQRVPLVPLHNLIIRTQRQLAA